MDDRTWIREDTLTMQLAIPPDLRIYNRYIYNDEMVQSNWCNRMTKMSERMRTAQHCQVVRSVDLHGRAGDIHVQ